MVIALASFWGSLWYFQCWCEITRGYRLRNTTPGPPSWSFSGARCQGQSKYSLDPESAYIDPRVSWRHNHQSPARVPRFFPWHFQHAYGEYMVNIWWGDWPSMWEIPWEQYGYNLVGGFKHEFYFPEYMGCHPSHWLSYFSDELRPPTRLVVNGVRGINLPH